MEEALRHRQNPITTARTGQSNPRRELAAGGGKSFNHPCGFCNFEGLRGPILHSFGSSSFIYPGSDSARLESEARNK